MVVSVMEKLLPQPYGLAMVEVKEARSSVVQATP